MTTKTKVYQRGHHYGVVSKMAADRTEANDQISGAIFQQLYDQFDVAEVRPIGDDYPLYFVSKDGRVFSRKPVGSDVQRGLNDPERKWRELRPQGRKKDSVSVYTRLGVQKPMRVSVLLEWAGWNAATE